MCVCARAAGRPLGRVAKWTCGRATPPARSSPSGAQVARRGGGAPGASARNTTPARLGGGSLEFRSRAHTPPRETTTRVGGGGSNSGGPYSGGVAPLARAQADSERGWQRGGHSLRAPPILRHTTAPPRRCCELPLQWAGGGGCCYCFARSLLSLVCVCVAVVSRSLLSVALRAAAALLCRRASCSYEAVGPVGQRHQARAVGVCVKSADFCCQPDALLTRLTFCAVRCGVSACVRASPDYPHWICVKCSLLALALGEQFCAAVNMCVVVIVVVVSSTIPSLRSSLEPRARARSLPLPLFWLFGSGSLSLQLPLPLPLLLLDLAHSAKLNSPSNSIPTFSSCWLA